MREFQVGWDPDSRTGGYFWRGDGGCGGEGRGMASRRETVIHTCTISKRLVRIMFAAGVRAVVRGLR